MKERQPQHSLEDADNLSHNHIAAKNLTAEEMIASEGQQHCLKRRCRESSSCQDDNSNEKDHPQKKSKLQSDLLDHEYSISPSWSKAKMQDVADRLGLKLSQIYKWHWDRT